MQIKDKDYFIKFANYDVKDIEKMYEEFPKELVDNPNNWPKLETPIKANLHSLLWACRDTNMCPIPDRMSAFAQSFQQSLKSILDGIIMSQGQVHESDELNFIINLQERTITKYFFEDGRLIEKAIANPDDQGKTMITPGWLMFSCRSLLDFLCDRELKKLKKCPYCGKFYIQNKLYERQKYCPICSRKNKMTPDERANYQKKYRANPARIRSIEKKKREEKIQHLITNAGKTRKQAEIIIDNEM